MIRTFEGKGRLLMAPRDWFNAVARWILGLHSETGTVLIRNTANPKANGPTIDVDCGEVAKRLDARLKNDYPKADDTTLVGESLRWVGRKLNVDIGWVAKNIVQASLGDGEGQPLGNTALESGAQETFAQSGDAAYVAKNDTWAAGKGKGCKVLLCCRGTDNGADGALFFREATISPNGMITLIDKESQILQNVTHVFEE